MSADSTIRKIAALALCPDSLSQGIKQLDAIINAAVKTVKRWHYIHLVAHFILWLAATLSVFMAMLLSSKYSNLSILDNYGMIGFLAATASLCAVFLIWRSLQHGYFYRRFGRFIDALIPAALQQLINDFASEERSAWTKAGSVDAGFFESRWAVFLFSKDPEIRDWVRSSKGRKETREIYTTDISVATITPTSVNVAVAHSQPVSADLSVNADMQVVVDMPPPVQSTKPPALAVYMAYKDYDGPESPMDNNNPAHRWLVGDSREKYEANRDKALDRFIPSQQIWKKFVLDGGRYELRSGGQVGSISAAVKEIQAELTRVFGHSKSPSGRKSDALIRRMLSSGKANDGIRCHFGD
jgi:hypothetical protein